MRKARQAGLGVSAPRGNRRVSRGLRVPAAELGDLHPDDEDPSEP